MEVGEALEDITHVFQSDEAPCTLLNQVMQEILEEISMGQFVKGNFYLMAILYFSIILGLVSMKFILNDTFVVPSLEMATAF